MEGDAEKFVVIRCGFISVALLFLPYFSKANAGSSYVVLHKQGTFLMVSFIFRDKVKISLSTFYSAL